MKKLAAIVIIFISFNVFANNMKPMQIAYFSEGNKQHSFYTEHMSLGEIAAFEACHLSEKEINFFNDQIIYPEDTNKTFLGFDLDIIEMGLSFVSLGLSIIPTN
tara:strand:- start:345 stop:656 length:312 start_codon:yes stop_codon:yes gene_type:complete